MEARTAKDFESGRTKSVSGAQYLKNVRPEEPINDWREQMKKIISRNLQQRDAYADKHETLCAKPSKRHQNKLRRPEEPMADRIDRSRRVKVTGKHDLHITGREPIKRERITRAGNPNSMGQFYCAPQKSTSRRARGPNPTQTLRHRTLDMKRYVNAYELDTHRREYGTLSRAQPARAQTARAQARARVLDGPTHDVDSARFSCILLDGFDQTEGPESMASDWGKTMSASCADSVLHNANAVRS